MPPYPESYKQRVGRLPQPRPDALGVAIDTSAVVQRVLISLDAYSASAVPVAAHPPRAFEDVVAGEEGRNHRIQHRSMRSFVIG